MQQATWNLCPVNTSFSTDCYYDTDKAFSQLEGELHIVIDDVPDGNWTIQVGDCLTLHRTEQQQIVFWMDYD